MWEKSRKLDFWRWNGNGVTFDIACTVTFNQDGSADIEMVIGEPTKEAYEELIDDLKEMGVTEIITKRNGKVRRRKI